MPRRGRLHIGEDCYHVKGRGSERRYIYESIADKTNFDLFRSRIRKAIDSVHCSGCGVDLLSSAISGRHRTKDIRWERMNLVFRNCKLLKRRT